MLVRSFGQFSFRIALGLTCALAHRASAVPTNFTGFMNQLAASASFDVSGNNLIVTLRNTSKADVLVPADILTALFFNINGPPLVLTRISALLGNGATVMHAPIDPHPENVGGEWAHQSNLSVTDHGAMYGHGISSAGFDLFGPGDRFDTMQDLQGPPSGSVDGMQYGITSPADDPMTGNMPVTGPNAFIQSEVVFTLGGLPDGFNPATSIKGVVWQYGTDTGKEPHFPEPATILLLGAGGIVLTRRQRRTR